MNFNFQILFWRDFTHFFKGSRPSERVCMFFLSGNWIFLPFIDHEFTQASTGSCFLPTELPWECFVHQMTRIAYWDAQALAPVVLLIVLQGGFTTTIVEMCWKNVLDQARFSSFWLI